MPFFLEIDDSKTVLFSPVFLILIFYLNRIDFHFSIPESNIWEFYPRKFFTVYSNQLSFTSATVWIFEAFNVFDACSNLMQGHIIILGLVCRRLFVKKTFLEPWCAIYTRRHRRESGRCKTLGVLMALSALHLPLF